MNLTRTTLRLQTNLKQAAERQAAKNHKTLQDVFNEALQQYLDREARRSAHKITFHTHNLGTPLDNLTRYDYYPDL